MNIRKWLMLAVLTVGVGVPSIAFAATEMDLTDCSWCPICVRL
jgi:hypothetical protein